MAESRLGLETYKVRLEHLVVPESKKMVKTKEKKKKKNYNDGAKRSAGVK